MKPLTCKEPLTCEKLLDLISKQFRNDGGKFRVTPKDVAKQALEGFDDRKTAEYVKAFFPENEGALRVMVVCKRTDPSQIFYRGFEDADDWIKDNWIREGCGNSEEILRNKRKYVIEVHVEYHKGN